MTDYVIPCDTIARLSKVIKLLPDDASDWFRSIRIDNGVALASNRRCLVAEHIGGTPGVIHLIADPALIAQCVKEAAFNSTVTITVNDVLKFATAKTSMGYVQPGNCCRWSDHPNDFDKWRELVETARTPAPTPKGGMFWDTDLMITIANASPSGRLVFETVIDATGRPTIIRDINDYNWFALFVPMTLTESYSPAALPNWMI